MNFVYQALPARVIFGLGKLEKLPGEVDLLGLKRVLVLCTPYQRDEADRIAAMLGERAIGIFDQATMHVPIELAQRARAHVIEHRVDGLVTVGGGSTTGLAKAIALTSGLPTVAIPTTYAGSEMTPIWGLTEGENKTTGRDLKIIPRTVIYDPSLTVTMPAMLSATSGMNAIAHCVEALYAENANPIMSLMAEEGIRALATSLPKVVKNGGDLEARSEALYGAWLGGCVLGAVGMALHHKLCHVLGGTFNLPHAEVHTVVLPHAVAYNAQAAPVAMRAIARALGRDDAAQGLYDLEVTLGTPITLAALGMQPPDLDRAADLAIKSPYYNPRPITRAGIRALLDDAFSGRRPNP
ncbi:MAG: maleylacetate reductase [Candidatus Binataceae bacterium]|nr:maleylacetate reductase [Candidatus Binataceae bacterium]